MAFLKKLGSKLGEVAGEATEKAKDFAEITKLKNDISNEKKKIKGAFLNLGKLYYDQIKDSYDRPGTEFCSEIQTAEAAIAELEEKIESVKSR